MNKYLFSYICSFNQKSKYRFLKKCQETLQPSENQGETLHNSKLKFAYSLFKQTSLAFDADIQQCISFSQPLPFCQFVILMLHYLVQRKKVFQFPHPRRITKECTRKKANFHSVQPSTRASPTNQKLDPPNLHPDQTDDIGRVLSNAIFCIQFATYVR